MIKIKTNSNNFFKDKSSSNKKTIGESSFISSKIKTEEDLIKSKIFSSNATPISKISKQNYTNKNTQNFIPSDKLFDFR